MEITHFEIMFKRMTSPQVVLSETLALFTNGENHNATYEHNNKMTVPTVKLWF